MKTTEKPSTPPKQDTTKKLTKEEKKQAKREKKEAKREAKRLKKKEKKEGRRIRTIEPINALIPFIMKRRNDSANMFEDELDTKAADEYIAKKRKEGLKSFSMMHLLLAAYVRTVAEYPGINRYIRGQRVMARNRIIIVMNVKRELSLDKGETVVKFFPQPTATAEEVYHHVEDTIREATEVPDTDFDRVLAKITKLPRFLLRGFIRFVEFLDYYGLAPYSLLKYSPFHASLYVTSMGSLGLAPVFHHIYEFGNVPLFLSFGTTVKKAHIKSDGTVMQKKVFPVKVTCDDRICDGHYYAVFFKTIRHYFRNPELLDVPAAVVNEDIP